MEDPEILGELEERFVQPYQATKTYLCPGGNREIPPVSATWSSCRSTPPTFAGTGTAGAGSDADIDPF